MKAIKETILGIIGLGLVAAIALPASAYVLLIPNHKWGDPDEPVEYRLNYTRNEQSIPGDQEFVELRQSFQVWENEGTRLAFYEGPSHVNCDYVDDGLNELSFDECGGNCTGSCIAQTRSIVDLYGEQMWQNGPDGLLSLMAKRDADILFNPAINFWSPIEGACVGYQFSLVAVAVHEIGHLLGLGHSPNTQATMYYAIAPCQRTPETLHIDDINGLQQLYNWDMEEYVYHDHTNGVVAISVNNSGNFGYTGQGGRWGRSFEFPMGSTNLFEGCVAVATTGGTAVSDDFRGYGINGQDGDFIQLTGITVIDGSDPLQFASSEYEDSVAETPYGVRVTQRSFIFPAGTDQDYVILQYRIHNESGGPLDGVHVGLFMDWDLQDLYQNNSIGYVSELGLGWVSDPGTPRQAGAGVLNPEGVVTYRALYATDQTAPERFSEENKYAWMFSGFDRTQILNNDIAMLIATGPFAIAAHDSATAAFAILSGENHADLRANQALAEAKYPQIQHYPGGAAITGRTAGVPGLQLAQNRPNPFQSTTRIEFSLSQPGYVSLGIFDVAGRLVRTLLARTLDVEDYGVVWDRRDDDGQRVAPGVYFYRLETPAGDQVRKIHVAE